MTALSADQLVFLQTKLGSTSDTADLQARYDRLGDTVAVAREVLEIRFADLLNQPDTFSVAGEYSQGTKDQIARLRTLLDGLGESEDEPTATTARLVGPARSPRR